MVAMTTIEAFALRAKDETVPDMIRFGRTLYFDLDEAKAAAGDHEVGQVILSLPAGTAFALAPAADGPLLMQFRDFADALAAARSLGQEPGTAVKVIGSTVGEAAFHSGRALSSFITAYAPLRNGEPSIITVSSRS